MTATRELDPWRVAGKFLKNVLGGQIPDQPSHGEIPWTPVSKPLAESKVALLSTAGISMQGDEPFDMEGERKRPTWGDPSWRALRADATGETTRANHLHIDTGYIRKDINVALPLDRLRELAAAGEVGVVADTHYSVMGFQGADSSTLENVSGPEIASSMLAQQVDLALLAPV